MAEREEIGKVKLRNVRASFCHVFEKTRSGKDGPLKYRCNFLIDPNTAEGKKTLDLIEDAIDDVKSAVWPGIKPEKVKIKPDRMSFAEGDDQVSQKTGEVYEGYEGMMVVKANNDRRIKLRDRDGETEITEDDDKIYSGAVVTAYVRFYGMKDPEKGGNGIFCTLDGIQFVKHGEKFGGGGMDDDEFDKLSDDEDDDDRPRKRGRSIDDEDDDRPSKRRSREDDDAPRRRSRAEDDDRPKKRRVMDDDDI